MTDFFYTNTWENKIAVVTVDKFTDSSVWVGGQRRSRQTTSEFYALTWDGAHKFLLAHWEAEVFQARRSLEYLNGRLGNVKGLQRPADRVTEG